MPLFKPIDGQIDFDYAAGTLARMTMRSGALEAIFESGVSDAEFEARIPGVAVRVTFSAVEVVRVADEYVRSTEESDAVIGIVPTCFAYEVTGSRFWTSQPDLVQAQTDLRHYQFITGATCLDVIASVPPGIRVA